MLMAAAVVVAVAGDGVPPSSASLLVRADCVRGVSHPGDGIADDVLHRWGGEILDKDADDMDDDDRNESADTS